MTCLFFRIWWFTGTWIPKILREKSHGCLFCRFSNYIRCCRAWQGSSCHWSHGSWAPLQQGLDKTKVLEWLKSQFLPTPPPPLPLRGQKFWDLSSHDPAQPLHQENAPSVHGGMSPDAAVGNTLPFTAQAPFSITTTHCGGLHVSECIHSDYSWFLGVNQHRKKQGNFNSVDGQITISFLQTELSWVWVWCGFFNSELIDGSFKCVKWSRYDSKFFKAIRQVW